MTTTLVTPLLQTPLTSDVGVVWTVQARSGPVPDLLPATVPGEVHTDLLAAGAIPDPFDGANEAALAWIGRTSWLYRAAFTWAPGDAQHDSQRHDLVAEGLDTVATIRLNGREVGRTANQHRTHRFDVGALLIAGPNMIEIEFEAPVEAAERMSRVLGPRPHVNGHPYNGLRKMASNFGWDWGPDVAGVGIWKPLRIESWSGVRVASVRPLATVDGTRGVLDAHVELEWAGAESAVVAVRVGDTSVQAEVAVGQRSVTVTAGVEGVERWWPRGHGDQPLYDTSVAVQVGGAAVDGWAGRVGFRTVTLDVAPDSRGGPFTISVNSEPVYVRGANWIPDDAFLTRLTPETYRTGVTEAVAANMNLLRVWGGGFYESEHFYAACDELGVLVWQDFLFACAAYAEEEPLRAEVIAEAREAVTRLSAHASLALWNGCNENIWGYVEWKWRSALAGRTWGAGYYLDVLPGIVAELDPRTPYSAGSPFSYDSFIHPNDERNGTMHIWDVWNQVDYTTYRDYSPRFVAEFGFQGPPAWSTLTAVVHDDPLDPYGAQMLVHQKADEGNLKLERGLGAHLPRWTSIDDWHWATQLNQARAVAYGIEHFRSLYPLNTGSVVWQLNDNWPVVSWAAVDGYGVRKPLWYALRRVYADRLVTVQPRDGVPTLVVHNDSPDPWSVALDVTRAGFDAAVLALETVEVEVAARDAATIPLTRAITESAAPDAEFVDVRGPGAEPAFWYFREDTELRLAPDACTASARRTTGGYEVEVVAHALVKDLCLFPDRLDPAARVDTGLVTLVAGERHTFVVTSGELDLDALCARPVLRCVNDLF